MSKNIKEYRFLNFSDKPDSKKDDNLYKFNIKKEFKKSFDFDSNNSNFSPMFIGDKKISKKDYEERLKKYFKHKKEEIDIKLDSYFKTQKSEAEQILEKAKIESEKLLNEKSKQGYEEGFEKGYKEGLEKGFNEEKNNFAEFKSIINHIKDFEKNLIFKFEEKFKKIIIEISKKIIKKELECSSDETLKKNIEYVLQRIVDKEYLNILINPAQYDFLQKHIEEIKEVFDIEKVKIIKSTKVKAGSCIIESNFGTYDAQIDEQIAELEKLLG